MRKAIAIDFDGCLCMNAYPEIGAPNWDVIERAKREQQDGAGLILWTCREGALLEAAVEACKGWGLAFDAVNDSLPDWVEAFGTQPRKVGASEYWDDRAVRMPDVQMPERPLTLDELRAHLLHGHPHEIAPLYVVFNPPMPIDYASRWRDAYNLSQLVVGQAGSYGKTWLAYRRKPEAAQCSTS